MFWINGSTCRSTWKTANYLFILVASAKFLRSFIVFNEILENSAVYNTFHLQHYVFICVNKFYLLYIQYTCNVVFFFFFFFFIKENIDEYGSKWWEVMYRIYVYTCMAYWSNVGPRRGVMPRVTRDILTIPCYCCARLCTLCLITRLCHLADATRTCKRLLWYTWCLARVGW